MKEDVTFWTWLKAWSDDHSGLIALAAFSLPMLFACLRFAYAPKRWERLQAYFNDPASYPMLLERFQSNGADAYFTSVRRVLLFATRVYGRKPWSRRAFVVCIILACFYPIFAAILAWIYANISQPGGMELFQDINNPFERAWRGAALVFLLLFTFWTIRNYERFARLLVGKLAPYLGTANPKTGYLETVAVFLVEMFVVLGAIIIAVAFAGAVTGAVAVAISGAFAGAFAGALGRFSTFLGSIAIATAVVVNSETLGVFTLFYVVLPILNAIADFMSIAATRWFLRRVTKRLPSIGFILLGVVGDLVVALLCLSLLLGALVLALETWSQLRPDEVPLDWRAYLSAMQTDKSQGIALYVMIGTTVLPTIIHVAAGLGAILTHKRRQLRSVARALEAQIALGVPFPAIEQDAHVAQIRRATFWGYGIAALSVVLFSYGLGVLAVEVTF